MWNGERERGEEIYIRRTISDQTLEQFPLVILRLQFEAERNAGTNIWMETSG